MMDKVQEIFQEETYKMDLAKKKKKERNLEDDSKNNHGWIEKKRLRIKEEMQEIRS